jgi:hypothetical protein
MVNDESDSGGSGFSVRTANSLDSLQLSDKDSMASIWLAGLVVVSLGIEPESVERVEVDLFGGMGWVDMGDESGGKTPGWYLVERVSIVRGQVYI